MATNRFNEISSLDVARIRNAASKEIYSNEGRNYLPTNQNYSNEGRSSILRDENYRSEGRNPDSSQQSTNQQSTGTSSDQSNINSLDLLALRNPLHNYATYTYGLTLFLLTVEDYNSIAEFKSAEEVYNWTPGAGGFNGVLISSAGKYQELRNANFKDDFYFDNLKMTTVIGASSTTRGTNAIEIKFNIIEPYGMTLLDRIMAATDEANNKNYMRQPYMLQIDFYGSDELGEMHTPIPELRKRIPIQLLEFKIKAGKGGSEYAISAVPFSQSGLFESTNITQMNLNITASTLVDFIDVTKATNIKEQKDQREKDLREIDSSISGTDSSSRTLQRQGGDISAVVARKQNLEATKVAVTNRDFVSKSYVGAWNEWERQLVLEKKVEIPNEIEIVIDSSTPWSEELLSSDVKLESIKTNLGSTTAQGSKSTQSVNTSTNESTPGNLYDTNNRIFNIRQGTSVTDVINIAMKNSSYITKQLVNGKIAENKKVHLFKIVPKVKLLEFDKKRNDYARKTTFTLIPYEYNNNKAHSFPTSNPPPAVKKYDYIYTGKNIDIIDFDINFDTAYYTSILVNTKSPEVIEKGSSSSSSIPGEDDNKANNAIALNGSYDKNNSSQQNLQASTSVRVIDSESSKRDAETAQLVETSHAMNSIYSKSGGDMISVKLKIIGDPHFIKQDEIYLNIGPYSGMVNSGTLSMDKGEIFCYITFKTPVDMNDSDGLIRKDNKFINSAFSGYYKILVVESELSKGQFIQTLECVRFPERKLGTEQSRGTVSNQQETSARERGLDISKKYDLTAEKAKEARDNFGSNDPRLQITRGTSTLEELARTPIPDNPINEAAAESMRLRNKLKPQRSVLNAENVDPLLRGNN